MSFTEKEREDLEAFFRVHDFAKVSALSRIIDKAEAKGTTAEALFEELFLRYRVTRLPDHARVERQMREAVPAASDADIASVIRQVEIKGFREQDAVRQLERQYGVRRMRLMTHPEATSSSLDGYTRVPSMRSTSLTLNGVPPTFPMHAPPAMPTKGYVFPPLTPPKLERGGSANRSIIFTEAIERPSFYGDVSAPDLTKTVMRESMDNVMAADVREWVAATIGPKFNEEVLSAPNFVDALRNGVVLNVLLQKTRSPPVGDEDIKLPKRVTGYYIRDNVAQFLAEAKKRYELVDAQLFTDSDLCDGKDDRQVITCLMAIARIAYTRGWVQQAPSVVVYEREILMQADAPNEQRLDEIIALAKTEEMEEEEVSPMSQGSDRLPLEMAQPANVDVGMERETPSCNSATVPMMVGSLVSTPATVVATRNHDMEGSAVDSRATTPMSRVLTSTPTKMMVTTATAPMASSAGAAQGDAVSNLASAVPEVGRRPSHFIQGGKTVVPRSRDASENERTRTRVVWKHNGGVDRREGRAPRYHSRTWDGLDVRMGAVLNAHYQRYPQSTWRFHSLMSNPGDYVMYSLATAVKRVLHVRNVQEKLCVCRQDRGQTVWVGLVDVLEEFERQAAKEGEANKICA